MENWYNLSTDEALAKLSTSLDTGLSTEVAQKRLEEYGRNELEQGAKKIFVIQAH